MNAKIAEVLSCPFASDIKEGLVSWVDGQRCSVVSGGAHKTKDYTTPEIHELKKLFTWMNGNLAKISCSLSHDTGSLYNLPEQNNKRNFKIDSYWLLNYPLHSWVEPHNHFPYALSFGYYINVPEQSSPLIIDNIKIDVKEGDLIVFMSSKMHWVPPAKVSGRTMIAGDILYTSNLFNKGFGYK